LLESFAEADITRYNGVFLGWLVVRGNGSNVSDTGDCRIIPGGFFRNTTGGGGASTQLNLDDLGDVQITSVANNQILRYDNTQGLWVNSAVTTLPLVTSFNGLTGAVTGVTVGGANTFTALNTFNAGISAAGGTFSSLTRFTAGITASTLYVTRGATFGNLTATDIYSTNLSAVTQYTDGLYPYTGTVVAINNNGNLTTIGDYGFEGDSDFFNTGTYISVNDTTQTVRIRAPNGIEHNGSFLNQVTAPSFADTYSFNETYRTTTTATTANQTIATIDSVYGNNEIPPVMYYPAFEVTISARDTVLNKTEMLKMLVVQDGTNTVNTQYGLIRTGATGPVSSYSTTLSGTPRNLLIRATPLSANSTVFTTTVLAQSNG
jgi:hypothetical protein